MLSDARLRVLLSVQAVGYVLRPDTSAATAGAVLGPSDRRVSTHRDPALAGALHRTHSALWNLRVGVTVPADAVVAAVTPSAPV